jgi:hypothetical protein
MAEPISTGLASIGAALKAFAPALYNFATAMLPALLGSVLGTRIYPERTWKTHATAIFAAGCLSYYGVGGAADYFKWSPGLFLELCKFVVGLFGFTIVLEAAKQIPLAISGLRSKFFGGTP